MKIVVVSPHRDDAAFSCGLSIEYWLSAGHQVTVLNCFTTSEYAPFAEVDTVHPNDRESFVTALRLREDREWLQLLCGSVRMHDLVLRDAPLRLRIPADLTQTTNPREGDRAVRRIRQAIDQLGPDRLILPLALGGHVDHLTAREAGVPETSSGVHCAFYEDLPYAARLGSGESAEAAAHAIDPVLIVRSIAAPGLSPEQAAARKRRMALCYDSQISDSTADEIAQYTFAHQGQEQLWSHPDSPIA